MSRPSPVYKADLVDANTMRNMPVGLGAAYSRSFRPVFNKPGSFSFTLPIDSKAASYVRNRRTGVMLSVDQVPIWSGGLTSIIKSAKAGTIACVATGWQEELSRRQVRKSEESTLVFATPGVVGGEIVHALVDAVNAQTNTDGRVEPLRIRFGAAGDTQARIRSYHVGDNYGALVDELISVENGLDLYVDPLSRLISTRDPADFLDRKNVRFGWGDGTAGNLDDVVEVDDGLSIGNRQSVVGPNGLVVAVDDQEAIDRAGVMLEDWTSISDVASTPTIAAFANAELVYKRYGTVTYSLTPKPYSDDMPRPYKEFFLGEQGYFSVNRGAFQVEDQAIRFFSLSIDIDDNGNGVVSEIGAVQS